MQRTTVRSAAIASLQYVPLAAGVEIPGAAGFLVVTFRSGASYGHAVPSWIPGLMMAARSKGRAYSKLVRGRFPTVKMEVA